MSVERSKHLRPENSLICYFLLFVFALEIRSQFLIPVRLIAWRNPYSCSKYQVVWKCLYSLYNFSLVSKSTVFRVICCSNYRIRFIIFRTPHRKNLPPAPPLHWNEKKGPCSFALHKAFMYCMELFMDRIYILQLSCFLHFPIPWLTIGHDIVIMLWKLSLTFLFLLSITVLAQFSLMKSFVSASL